MIDDPPWCEACAREKLMIAIDYIQSSRLREQSIYVHCKQGVSRSGAVVLAFLMKYCVTIRSVKFHSI